MILITGATGQLGGTTLDFLLEKKNINGIVAMARDSVKAATLKTKGVEVRIADYTDYDSLIEAFEGVDILLFISSASPESSERRQHHINVINAAKEKKVKHVVYTSVLKASDTAKFLPATEHYHTEQYLQQTGITYTVFRNTMYAEAIPQLLGNALQSGTWYFPAGNAKNNFASRTDIAEALATVISQPLSHQDKVYEIASGQSYSCGEIAAMISHNTGKPMIYNTISLEMMKKEMEKVGIPEAIIALISSGVEAIDAGEFDITDTSLENILGRKPADLKDYLKMLV
jgi:NAD(P)H dehydrogenase (quinone)